MFLTKIIKFFKKYGSTLFFSFTILYLLYTYLSIFLYYFNNVLFYVILNTFLFYFGFHFIVRALTYPGSLYIFYSNTNYENRIELSKFYYKECVRLSNSFSKIYSDVKEMSNVEEEVPLDDETVKENESKNVKTNKVENTSYEEKKRIKIYMKDLFKEDSDTERYFKLFSSVYGFYTLYASYYLYLNIENPTQLSAEQLSFYYYLKLFVMKINEIELYVPRKDLLHETLFTRICIQKDLNKYVQKYVTNGISLYYNTKDYYKNPDTGTYERIGMKSKENESNKDKDSLEYIPFNVLSLFYHENYEKTFLHSHYKDFYMDVVPSSFLTLIEEILCLLRKLREIFKTNTYKERFQLRYGLRFFKDLFKNPIVGSLDLFKYDLVYKYYGKQQYLKVNKTILDCMFIPSKQFLKDHMEKYVVQKCERNNFEFLYNRNSPTCSVFYNVFNNEYYDFMYQKEYLKNVPVVLYFNPNASYYELNMCSFDSVQFYLDNNISVFVYNYRGYSRSKGIPTFSRNNEDALNLAQYLLSKGVRFLGLHGRSIGGPLCFYVSYHLSGFDSNYTMDKHFVDHYEKRELQIKKVHKDITKILKMVQTKSIRCSTTNVFRIGIRSFNYSIVLLLFFIRLLILECSPLVWKLFYRKTKLEKKDRTNRLGTTSSKLAFLCVDKSFSNFEVVAKYMIGTYAYQILQFSSHKLDITKYFIESNVPKIIIYDNCDEIIHYMSNVLTGVSNQIVKLYKQNEKEEKKLRLHCFKEETTSPMEKKTLLPLVDSVESDKSFLKEIDNSNTIWNSQAIKGECFIVDTNVDSSWKKYYLKKLDRTLFAESWSILNDVCAFLNKNETKNNTLLSMCFETYQCIISLFNSKEMELSKDTNKAIYCIYNDRLFSKGSFGYNWPTYERLMNKEMNEEFKEGGAVSIYDFLQEHSVYSNEIKRIDSMLKDLYMSKRKEIQKVHFTYGGFFLKNDFLQDFIEVDNKSKEVQETFQIGEVHLSKFLKEFHSSINEILRVINNHINSGGQLFEEINRIGESEREDFLKSFINRMKVFGSYPSQCFQETPPEEADPFCNYLFHLPCVLSHYSKLIEKEHEETEQQQKQEERSYDFTIAKEDEVTEKEDRGPTTLSSCHELEEKKKALHISKKPISKISIYDNLFFSDSHFPTSFVILKKNMLLYDLIICLNRYHKNENKNTHTIFYKIDEDQYLIDLKELYQLLKDSRAVPSNSVKFLEIFSKDIGIEHTSVSISKEMEKFVSWLRLNSRISICKVLLTIEEELNKMKNYSLKLTEAYNSISQNTTIQFIIFLIYRIMIYKKLITHIYIIYTFFLRLIKSFDFDFSMDIKTIHNQIQSLDKNTVRSIDYFTILYKNGYKVFSPKILGYPFLVHSGHNGNLNKREQNFLQICLDSFLQSEACTK